MLMMSLSVHPVTEKEEPHSLSLCPDSEANRTMKTLGEQFRLQCATFYSIESTYYHSCVKMC